jgi:hypothetical protein
MLKNYVHKYQTRGKYIYEPNDDCERRAVRILHFFKRIEFPDYFYHYKSGGHVLALHEHLKHDFFFKIDLQHFFYSIARNRVTRTFRSWGLKGAPTYAKWSCVRSPYPTGPRYVVPIGFRQSPLVASLVLMQSPVAAAIEKARASGITISVYLDDFIGSHDDEAALRGVYEDILAACLEANLVPNVDKLVAPAKAIVAFNCNVSKGSAKVTEQRKAEFFSEPHTGLATASFEDYVARVAETNAAAE